MVERVLLGDWWAWFGGRVGMVERCCYILLLGHWVGVAGREGGHGCMNESLFGAVLQESVCQSVSQFMAFVHGSVNEMSKVYLANERRYNYTTPKSFLELVGEFHHPTLSAYSVFYYRVH